MKKPQKDSKRKIIEDTHKNIHNSLMEAAKEYSESERKVERYEKVKDFFYSLKERSPHPGVLIKEIDLSQNDRVIDTESEDFLALKESIKNQGLIQRPVLTLGLTIEKPFLCIAGHRRILALKSLGESVVPSDLIYTKEQNDIKLTRLAENLVRENLKPLELAEAVKNLKEELNEKTTGVARLLNKDRTFITQLIKLASWPDSAKAIVKRNSFTLKSLLSISKRKLNSDQIVKEIEKLELLKSDGPSINTKSDLNNGSLRKGATAFIEKRNIYFQNKNLSQKDQDLIVGFLKENKIKGWY